MLKIRWFDAMVLSVWWTLGVWLMAGFLYMISIRNDCRDEGFHKSIFGPAIECKVIEVKENDGMA